MKYFIARGEDLRLEAASRAALRGSFLELSDGITHYELSGPERGETVVLVGGLTVPLFYWDRLVALLHTAGLRTLSYSSYGRGYSDRIEGPYDDALFIRQLTGLIHALDLRQHPHHLVGASMGALIAMGYTVQNAGLVATLTVAGPAGLSEKPAALRWLQRSPRLTALFARYFGRSWLASHEANDLGDRTHAAELAAMLRDAYRHEGSLHALFDTLLNFRLFDRAPLYQAVADSGVPTLLTWGQQDRVTPIDKIDSALALLRPQQCRIIECGHMVPFERPREVADNIVSFVGARTERKVS